MTTVVPLEVTAPGSRVTAQLRQAMASVGGAKVVGAVGGIAAARLLGPEAKGEHAIALLIGTVLATVLTGGVEVWAQRVVAAGEHADVSAIVRLQHRASFTIVAVLTAGAVAIDVALGGRWATVILATAAMCWVTSASMTPLGVLLGEGRVARHATANVAGACTYLIVVVVLAALDVRSVALVLVGAAIGAATTLTLAHRRLPRPTARTVDWRPALRFGTGSMVGEVATLLSLRVDLFLVAGLATVADAGVYAVALAVAEVLILAPNAVAMLMVSHTARTHDPATTRRVAMMTTAVTAVAALLLAGTAPFYVPVVFGRDFDGAVGLIWLLGGAGVLGAGSKVLVADLLGAGVSRPRMTSALSGLVSMVLVDTVLVPRYAAAGAAAGSVVGAAVTLAVVQQAWSRKGAA